MKLTTLIVFLFSTLASVQAQSHSGNTLQPVSTGTSSEPDPTIGIPRPHSRPITTDSITIGDTSTLLTIQTSTALPSSTITTTDSSTITTADSSSNSSSTAPPASSSSLPGSTTSSIASNSTSPAGNGAGSMVGTSALGVLMGVFGLLALTR